MEAFFGLDYTEAFFRAYRKLPSTIQKKTLRQLQRLTQDATYPGLRVRKMTDRRDIWEARIDRDYRITFERRDGDFLLRTIGRHDDTYSRH